MPVIGTNLSDPKQEEGSINASACALCCLVKNRKLDPIEIIPGGAMKIVRESPKSAIVSFKAGSVEPAHHHTFGHDLVVLKGSKRVWNLSKKAKYDLVVGDYLFTLAGDVHRVKYFEDTEFFIKWEGKWDIFFDEEMEVAKSEISKEADDGFELIFNKRISASMASVLALAEKLWAKETNHHMSPQTIWTPSICTLRLEE
ncbi:hypothetical protein DKX38_022303 [Salix brachista]|uniref:Cupin 2 conserved barrel domain-containing protein n=1 Tax=Salix brachista TaxID=2182728 RepID=A0A5N5K2G2_9ROSI|nr:hypothetical protein DKX38_022303 [Salix brachista]